MRTRCLIGSMGALCAATLAWGQAVPSQVASVQAGSWNGGSGLQVQYDLNHQGYNNSQEAFIQFDLSVFPAHLASSAIQKATLVLYSNSGGAPGRYPSARYRRRGLPLRSRESMRRRASTPRWSLFL